MEFQGLVAALFFILRSPHNFSQGLDQEILSSAKDERSLFTTSLLTQIFIFMCAVLNVMWCLIIVWFRFSMIIKWWRAPFYKPMGHLYCHFQRRVYFPSSFFHRIFRFCCYCCTNLEYSESFKNWVSGVIERWWERFLRYMEHCKAKVVKTC